jgi:putative Holliday junction resolvase
LFIIKNLKREFGAIPAGRIMGIDYGQRRIGLALSDPAQILSSSLMTITNRGDNAVVSELRRIVSENSISAIVVGMPLNMNGSVGPRGKETIDFMNVINERLQLPVIPWDERLTSVSAQQVLTQSGKSPSRNKDKIDRIAAAILLQAFLDRLKILRSSIIKDDADTS